MGAIEISVKLLTNQQLKESIKKVRHTAQQAVHVLNVITSINLYTGGDEKGNETRIRFHCSAAVNSPLRVYEIEQVIS